MMIIIYGEKVTAAMLSIVTIKVSKQRHYLLIQTATVLDRRPLQCRITGQTRFDNAGLRQCPFHSGSRHGLDRVRPGESIIGTS